MLKIYQSWRRKQHPGTESSVVTNQIQPKEEIHKTHHNQTFQNQRLKKIVRAAIEKTHITFNEVPVQLSEYFLTETLGRAG